jgi:hypothetical protein
MGAERRSSRARTGREHTGGGVGGADSTVGVDPEGPARGFRPSARRRRRLAIGVGLGALAIAGNLAVYSSLDDRAGVLQVVADVPAGEELRAEHLRVVELGLDPTVRAVDATAIDQVVGQYAKVRMVAGSLVVVESLQPLPLVEPGTSIVALQLPSGSLPVGLRERSLVQIVVPVRSTSVEVEPVGPVVVTGRVVGLPTVPDGVTATVSLSVEVPSADAPALAVGEDVRVVLLPPTETLVTATDVADTPGVGSGAGEAAASEAVGS